MSRPVGPVPLGLDAVRVAIPPTADRGALLPALLAVPGVLDAVVGEASAAVWFDPGAPPPDIAAALEAGASRPSGVEHRIRTRYDGPDLAEVARQVGVPVAEVIARHAARRYTVLFLGFAPGFAYLGEVDPVLQVPRRATPRPVVPAGAVAIAGPHTAVYPGGTPGGWNLIGAAQDAGPVAWAVGDVVTFVPV